jgi:lysophospholipase L1-like esterase
MKKAVIIFVVILAIGLVALEIYFRKTVTYIEQQEEQVIRMKDTVERDPRAFCKSTAKGRRFVPNTHAVIRNHLTSRRDVKMDINSNGFRGEEIPKEKKDGEIRILVMGDSITCGDTLPIEEIFVTKMGKYLNDGKRKNTVRVINGGLGDIGLEEEVDILIEQGLAVKPDIVLFVFYTNDSRPPWGFTENIGQRGWLRKHSVLAETIYKNIKFKQWMKQRGPENFAWTQEVTRLDWVNDRASFRKLADMAKYEWGAGWQEDSWSSVRDDFRRVKVLSEKNKFKVGIVAYPVAFQVYANFVDDYPQRKLEDIAKSLGFKYHDLLPLLRNNNKQKLFFDQCHPLAVTNDLVGREIADFINKDFPEK